MKPQTPKRGLTGRDLFDIVIFALAIMMFALAYTERVAALPAGDVAGQTRELIMLLVSVAVTAVVGVLLLFASIRERPR